MDEPRTICVECNNHLPKEMSGGVLRFHICLHEAKYQRDAVTGVTSLVTDPISCYSKNEGDCPDFEEKKT